MGSPACVRSPWSDVVNDSTAALVAAYSARPGTGARAEIDAMLRMPPPVADIAPTAAREPAITPRTLTSRMLITSASV